MFCGFTLLTLAFLAGVFLGGVMAEVGKAVRAGRRV